MSDIFKKYTREIAQDNYEKMKHAAGVSPGKEYILAINGEFVPCSREEFKNGRVYAEHSNRIG